MSFLLVLIADRSEDERGDAQGKESLQDAGF